MVRRAWESLAVIAAAAAVVLACGGGSGRHGVVGTTASGGSADRSARATDSEPEPPPPPPPPPVQVSVLAYNVWFLPTVARDIPERAPLIPPHLARYDVVVLSEAFDDTARATVVGAMEGRGYTATPVLGTGRPIECSRSVGPVQVTVDIGLNGGVVVLGRNRLEQWQQRMFGDVCAGEDCCAQKGVMYARFRMDEDEGAMCLHVFGTHLQNADPVIEWGDPRDVRSRQLGIIRAFIDEQASAQAACPGPVIVAGDLNFGERSLAAAARTLRARIPPPREGPCSYGEQNQYTAGSRPAQLDWILLTEDFRAPRAASHATETFREQRPATEILCDLSDHHPVAAHFEWERER